MTVAAVWAFGEMGYARSPFVGVREGGREVWLGGQSVGGSKQDGCLPAYLFAGRPPHAQLVNRHCPDTSDHYWSFFQIAVIAITKHGGNLKISLRTENTFR